MNHITITIIIFLLSYLLIVTERIHRTVVALTGAAFLIIFGVFSQTEALRFVDFNTLGLIIGMVVIVGITSKSGVFQYLAILFAKKLKGDPVKLLILIGILSAVFTAFLSNVPDVLLLTPIIFIITSRLEIDPMPFLLLEIVMSNVGGVATSIGDISNILIASSANLSFNEVFIHLGPPILIVGVVTIYLFVRIYRKKLKSTEEKMQNFAKLHPKDSIIDMKLLKKSISILLLTIFGFIIHDYLQVDTATIALLGAGILFTITKTDPDEILDTVDWGMIFFFIGLFILIGALEHMGIISVMAQKIVSLTGDSLKATSIFLIWLSAILSSFVDNVPYVAAVIPLVKDIGNLTGMDIKPLWWSLALGASLGGSGTLIGASCNLVVVGLAEKNGCKIKFWEYFRAIFAIMLVGVAISSVYVWVVFL